MHATMPDHREILHAHLFAGLGGGARGFNRASARVGTMTASFRCLGGIDVDAAAITDFERLSGVRGTRLDLFDREQYRAFHDAEPAPDWHEATAADIHQAFGHERPHMLFLSPPCKGFSGLLSEAKSKSERYQALNRLTLRGLWLALETYADDPVELILLENVPRIASRGRALLDRMTALLRAYGYAVAETSHDCGVLGGLAQSRKRFLLVARHQQKVPPFLYEPPKRSLRGVGDVLGRMLLPGDQRAGPMHRVPSLTFQTWVRLAFVEAGSDWRSLARLRVVDGKLADYGLVPDATWRNGALGVTGWTDPAGTVTGGSRPTQGAFSVADPRHGGPAKFSNVYRVVSWDREAAAVTSSRDVAVADPRPAAGMFHNAFRTMGWTDPSQAITGQHAPSNGAMCVADPRTEERRTGTLGVRQWDAPSGTVAGESLPGNGAFAVADPRPGLNRSKGDNWYGGGHFGVVPWTAATGAVSAAAGCDNGHWSVADPRLPEPSDRLVAVIQSMDGCWHRPFSTLELAALQSLVEPEEHLELEGLSDASWRERIGNAVPPDAAQAIAETMGRTLLMAWSGEGFKLSNLPIWVQPMAVALSVQQAGDAARS